MGDLDDLRETLAQDPSRGRDHGLALSGNTLFYGIVALIPVLGIVLGLLVVRPSSSVVESVTETELPVEAEVASFSSEERIEQKPVSDLAARVKARLPVQKTKVHPYVLAAARKDEQRSHYMSGAVFVRDQFPDRYQEYISYMVERHLRLCGKNFPKTKKKMQELRLRHAQRNRQKYNSRRKRLKAADDDDAYKEAVRQFRIRHPELRRRPEKKGNPYIREAYPSKEQCTELVTAVSQFNI